MSKRTRSRPQYGAVSIPSNLHQHCCPHCQQLFQSVYSLAETAIANHRARSKSCFPTINKSAPFQQLEIDDLQAMIFTDGDHECLTEHIDWTRSKLNPDMNYSAVELNDAVIEMLSHEEAEKIGPVERDIGLAATSKYKPVSKDFLEFQALAIIKFDLPENDRQIFNLRNRVMWQDVLSLQAFGIRANLTEATGDLLLDLIGEIVKRHQLPVIPLHKSWKRLLVSVGRKLVPTASVRLATAPGFILVVLRFNVYFFLLIRLK